MKTMTCRQLGGACNHSFTAKTFEEIAELSKKHGMDMYKRGDEKHIKAMEEMMELMKDEDAMKEWMISKKKEFSKL